MTITPLWQAETLLRLRKLAAPTPAMIARVNLAGHLIRYSDIERGDFQIPSVFFDPAQRLHLLWQNRYMRCLEILIGEMKGGKAGSYSAIVWYPSENGKVDVMTITEHLVDRFRGLLAILFMAKTSASRAEIEGLLEVRRTVR